MFLKLLFGIITGNEEIKEYLRKKYAFHIARLTGDVPGPQNMDMDSMEDVLNVIGANYELVGIEIPRQTVTTLPIAIDSEKGATKAQTMAMNAVSKYMERQGVDTRDWADTTIQTEKEEKSPSESGDMRRKDIKDIKDKGAISHEKEIEQCGP